MKNRVLSFRNWISQNLAENKSESFNDYPTAAVKYTEWLNEDIGVEIAELRAAAKELRAKRAKAKEIWAENKNPGSASAITAIELELAETYDKIRKLELERRKD